MHCVPRSPGYRKYDETDERKCKHIFDDKSVRNEMLEDMAFEIKEAIQKAQEDQSPAYMMIITKKRLNIQKNH